MSVEADTQAALPTHMWDNAPSLTDSKLFHEYMNRLVAGRDMHVIITAASETGVGKTTLAIILGLLWDMHGWSAEKLTLSPREYAAMYEQSPPGTVLVMDEVEIAADTRRATSHDNVTISQAFAGMRYKQVFGIMTAPAKSWVDDRMGEDSADYWIQCQETPDGRPKGEAKVYRLKNNEHYETSYKKRHETIAWPVIDTSPLKKQADRIKASRMEGMAEDKYVLRSEYEDLKTNYWNKCMKKTRYFLVRGMWEELDVSQGDIARAVDHADSESEGEVEGLSQQRVSELTRAESFNEVYSR